MNIGDHLKPLWLDLAAHIKQTLPDLNQLARKTDAAHAALLLAAGNLSSAAATLSTAKTDQAARKAIGELIEASQAIRMSADVPRQAKMEPVATTQDAACRTISHAAAAVHRVIAVHWSESEAIDHQELNEQLYDLERAAAGYCARRWDGNAYAGIIQRHINGKANP